MVAVYEFPEGALVDVVGVFPPIQPEAKTTKIRIAANRGLELTFTT